MLLYTLFRKPLLALVPWIEKHLGITPPLPVVEDDDRPVHGYASIEEFEKTLGQTAVPLRMPLTVSLEEGRELAWEKPLTKKDLPGGVPMVRKPESDLARAVHVVKASSVPSEFPEQAPLLKLAPMPDTSHLPAGAAMIVTPGNTPICSNVLATKEIIERGQHFQLPEQRDALMESIVKQVQDRRTAAMDCCKPL